MSAELEVTGFEGLINKLESMGKDGDTIYDNALTKSAELILTEIQYTTAFKDQTGRLRKSFKISPVKKNKDGKFVWCGDVDRVAPYAWYQEHKTPFLRPAFEKHKKEVLETIKQAIAEGIKKYEE